MTQRYDVIVIGAGLAGLTAARRLVSAGKQVLVLEASSRAGGRTLSQPMIGEAIDLGGQWVGPTQERALALLRELEIATFDQYADGRKILAFGDDISQYKGTIPSLPLRSLIDLQWAITRLDWMSRRVPLDRPATARHADAWDAINVAQWIEQQVRTDAARTALEAGFRAVFAAEPRDLSLLHTLFYIRSGGGFMRLIAIRNGAQQTRIVGGTQQIAQRLAERSGAAIRYDSPVSAIAQDDHGVSVTTTHGVEQADRVIAAIAPALANRITYTPSLPANRGAIHVKVPMGAVIKCIAAYRTPFWRELGLSGEAISDGDVLQIVFDDSPHDGATGALVGFMLGDAARRWSQHTIGERARAVRDELVRLFGPQAAHPIAYVDKDWTVDSWTRGCYAGVVPPRVLTAHGDALRRPCGRIHWAGTETATRWNGYMDGAIESGERAADEILAL